MQEVNWLAAATGDSCRLPGTPVQPVAPAIPLAPNCPDCPGAPGRPVQPRSPCSPWKPLNPVPPLAPRLPGRPVLPGDPTMPRGPGEPGSPIQQQQHVHVLMPVADCTTAIYVWITRICILTSASSQHHRHCTISRLPSVSISHRQAYF